MYGDRLFVGIAFGLYFLATYYFAWISHRRQKGGFMEDFFVAGRELGPWIMGLTWIATAASGGTFIGAPALGYQYGWSVMEWICGYMIVATVGMGVLGKRIGQIGRATGALTIPDLLRDRYESPAVGIFSGVAIIILYTSYMVAQYIAGARVIEAALGIPYLWGVIGFAVTISLYTAYGGFRAVAWTDSFQAVVMLLGVLITAFLATRAAGGLDAVLQGLAAKSPELTHLPGPDAFLPLPAAISFFSIWSLTTLGQPALVSRFLACRDTATLKRASFLIGLYILLLYPAVIGIGIVGRVIVPHLETPDHAVPATIIAVAPPILAGVLLAAPFAAIMSTISAFMLVCSSAIVRDLYQRNRKSPLSESRARTLSHLATFGVAGAALIFALRPPDFLQYIVVFSGTGLASTFAIPTVLGVYWPGMNRPGCYAGLAGGFFSFMGQYAAYGTKSWFGFDPFIWALIISLVTAVTTALLTGPPPRDLIDRYF